jgi:DNA-binding MarR family transcriptional regulator
VRRPVEDEFELRNRYSTMERGELDQTVGFLLRAAWKEVSRQFNAFFREADFTPGLYTIMVLVDLNPGCNPGDLAKPMGISQNNLVAHVDELVERGFLTRSVHPRDRRVKVLNLTDHGKERLTELRKAHKLYEKRIAQQIGKDEMTQLLRILGKFEAVPD